MAWFKVDDGFHSSRKLLSIPKRTRLAALGLWTVAGSWSVQQGTWGLIPNYVLKELGGTAALAQSLIEAGLWSAADEGWQFTHWRKTQDGDYRRNIRASVREAVMRRDQFKCVLCDADENLSLDHIQRYRDDGPDTAENLRVLCMPCNLERG
jgi:hypothetical protein